jgi:hypothetical protein
VKKAEPAVRHNLEERDLLQTVLFDFNMNIGWQAITDRKIRAIDLIASLASQRETRQTGSSPSDMEALPEIPEHPEDLSKLEKIPLILKRKQCIFCIGDNSLPIQDRMRSFSRVSHMMDHIENVHLRHIPTGARLICHHPNCKHLGDFLKDLNHFKNHVQKVHRARLRG